VSSVSIIDSLNEISRMRRPVYKIAFSKAEGIMGRLFYNSPPPDKTLMGKRLLHLGCGDHHFPDWVNADYYRFSDLVRKRRGLPDWMLDAGYKWKCPDEYWDGIYTEHTLEHLDYPNVFVALKESLRTLKTGSWIRIVLPGLKPTLENGRFTYNAEAVAYLTQTFGHLSVWDSDMLYDILNRLGFSVVNVVEYNKGTDKVLIKDLKSRVHNSIYIEAKK
jgi:predicted SAM-dependent methyltransferase